MAATSDINIGIISNDEPKKQIESVVRQSNENFRLIANEDRTKIIKDDAGTERLLLGYKQDGFTNGSVGFKISQPGVSVLEATDDQLVLSSDFNMHKIIASGYISTAPRNANVTLTTTNIGYSHVITIDLGDILGSETVGVGGGLMLRVNGYFESSGQSNQMDIGSSGLFYYDGTNQLFYNYHYYILGQTIKIVFNVRLLAGTLTFNPTNYFAGSLYWELCNQTNPTISGGGAGGSGDGKFYFSDTITYNSEGTITTALVSSTEEFTGGASNHFPKPNVSGVPGFYFS